MWKNSAPAMIRLRGVRHHNLKNFDLDLPIGKLIVVTGLSGSGKSSLAFDTLFAEGQRRYIETFSPYARQFFDRMDKPQVDRIEGIPPAIAIEQRNAVKTTRSTVGTMTELTDYMKLLWPHLATLHCRGCGQPVGKESPSAVWEKVNAECGVRSAEQEARLRGEDALITFDLALSEKLSLAESLVLVTKQGYQRLLVGREIIRIEDAASHSALRTPHSALTVVQDRLRVAASNRARFIEACEQAYHFGKGKLAIRPVNENSVGAPRLFSNRFHCATCDIDYRESTPALFSFNHPLGACPACRGFGRTITIDYDLAIPDRSKTLAEGAVKPWQTSTGAESQRDMARMCRAREIPMDVSFNQLSAEHQRIIIDGDPDYGSDEEHEWPRAWYGVKGYFRWLESRAYKMHVRVLLSRYRAYVKCPDCQGKRFQPESLLYRIGERTLADFYQLSIRDALAFVGELAGESASGILHDALPQNSFTATANGLVHPDRNRTAHRSADILSASVSRQIETRRVPSSRDPLTLALNEVRSRLAYLDEVGLGYLTLDRPTRSLSGGETERVNLTTCLGTRLVNTLFVLDEPSVGLHPRDTDRLVRILKMLRDTGNTVVVVEHEPAVMRAADHIVDLGPGHGESGGQVVFQGSFENISRARQSLTGQYLSGRKEIEARARREVTADTPKLRVAGANVHNLKNLSVEIPLGRFVCLTGVSGSGKTTLARDVLFPLLSEKLSATTSDRPQDAGGTLTSTAEESTDDGKDSALRTPHSAFVSGWESLSEVVLVDQSPLGRTPRSNPAVYIGAFEAIRELFAQTEAAKQHGLNASAFSFNSGQGQCEKCRGAGFEKIEMQFLSDVFIRCPDCNGRRYREHILEIKVESQSELRVKSSNGSKQRRLSTLHSPGSQLIHWSIADLLEATIDEVLGFLRGLPASRPRDRALSTLKLLQDVGLGYLRAGQPINTLSGGESQRLKLVSHLAESSLSQTVGQKSEIRNPKSEIRKSKLFIFDEPTTGLHFDDVRVLLEVFQRLVDEGHSLLVIEHNLELIKCADWIIDLGPDAGDAGGEVVVAGTPAQVAENWESLTGAALRDQRSNRASKPGARLTVA